MGEADDKTSGWLKLSTAAYYCGASMAVQFINKVSRYLAVAMTRYRCYVEVLL